MKEISSGIIPYRLKNNKIEFFVGHPGGPYWENKNYYAFIKGHVENGESLLECALREFKEETNFDLYDRVNDMVSLGCVSQNSKKTVFAFSVECDIDENLCFSNKCEVNFPFNSNNKILINEIDDYKWLSFEDLKNITSKKHLSFYKQILEFYDRDSK